MDTRPGQAYNDGIDCGLLIVPENRRKPESRSIRLPVMIFRSPSAAPVPDPILFIPGGPRNSNAAGRRSGKGLPLLDERDFVVLEQRGTRYARPALECPAVNNLKGEIAAGRLRKHGRSRCARQGCGGLPGRPGRVWRRSRRLCRSRRGRGPRADRARHPGIRNRRTSARDSWRAGPVDCALKMRGADFAQKPAR